MGNKGWVAPRVSPAVLSAARAVESLGPRAFGKMKTKPKEFVEFPLWHRRFRT